MKRRQALQSMLLVGGSAVILYSGFEVYSGLKNPDLTYVDNNSALIAELAEMIIPRTNTPGAKDVEAEKLIIQQIKSCYSKKDQNNFINGLKEVENESFTIFGKSYLNLNKDDKLSVLTKFQKRSNFFSGLVEKIRKKVIGKTFFTILKETTTISFCTSMRGATEVLEYQKIPISYNGCIPLITGQRSWATK